MKVVEKRAEIGDQWLSLHEIQDCLANIYHLELSENSIRQIIACREYLDHKLSQSESPFYGINTGFGFMQNITISDAEVCKLQENLILSHACGLGEEVPQNLVRYMMYLKIVALSKGHSGVRLETVERLLNMLKVDMIPVVYNQGSLGASGDLCPLSHMVLPLLGEGEVWLEGIKMKSIEALETLGWQALQLQAKEGLALINGTQFMLAYGLDLAFRSRRLLNWANLIAALSMEAFNASMEPLFEGIHRLRKQAGQQKVAEEIRKYRTDSELASSPKKDVQDPYSFRCVPQVHGASADALDYVDQIMENEVNAVTDNPLIFPDEDLIVSGGNFHGQPLALAFDHAAIALAELGNISERRVFQLLSGQRDLPLFLINQPGLHSGLMISQYTAASLVSENKQLCTPASVDSIVSSNGQEDHVSMGANAATKCRRVIDNLEKILAIELLSACQALSFRRPQQSSPILEDLYTAFRKNVSFNTEDRLLYKDIQQAISFIQEYPI